MEQLSKQCRQIELQEFALEFMQREKTGAVLSIDEQEKVCEIAAGFLKAARPDKVLALNDDLKAGAVLATNSKNWPGLSISFEASKDKNSKEPITIVFLHDDTDIYCVHAYDLVSPELEQALKKWDDSATIYPDGFTPVTIMQGTEILGEVILRSGDSKSEMVLKFEPEYFTNIHDLI